MSYHDIHHDCFFCGQGNQTGLQVKFETQVDGGMTGSFTGNASLQGYPGYLHGGIIAGLLDAAMTHCLLKRNIHAMTAELKIRYQKKIPVQSTVTVTATVIAERPPLYYLKADITDGVNRLATAEAKFMKTPVTPVPDTMFEH